MNEGNHLKLEHGQPRAKGWVFMVGCRNSSNGCASNKKIVRSQSQCFLAATWNHFLTMLNLQPVAHLLMLHVFCFHFVSFAHFGAHRISFNFRPQLSRRDLHLHHACLVRNPTIYRGFHVSGCGNLRFGVGTHTNRSLLRLLR